MVKIKFEIASFEKEAEFVYSFKKDIRENPEGVLGNCIYINLTEDLKKEIEESEALTKELKLKIINRIKRSYWLPELDSLKILLEKNWKEKGIPIIKEIERLTEKKLWAEEITCYITNVVCSSKPGGEIVLGIKELPDLTNKIPDFIFFIICEEILHAHYEKIINQIPKIKDKNFDEFKEWQVSETIPEFIFFENKNLDFLDKKFLDRSNFYTWINKIREDIRPFWNNKKNFEDFVINVYENYIQKQI